MSNSSGYLRQVKQANMSTVLKDIWRHEPVSRIELVDNTGLTSGTITNLTQDLLKAGLLKETELSTGNVGRKRMMLRLNTERFVMIGIDIGRTAYEVVATDLAGRILKTMDRSTIGMDDPHQILDLAAASVNEITLEMKASNQDILGIGLGIPGPMNLQDGVLLVPPNFPNWEYFPIVAELERRLNRNIVMHDDARTSALAERWFGYGRQESNFVYITIGHGIGGGIVSNGEIILGANGLYGQVGHITVIPDGELCECGNRGCWETVGSIQGILRRWSCEGEESSIEEFFQAVQARDPRAEGLLESTLQIMESTLTTLFNVYDPSLIVIGGKLYSYLKPYLPRIRNNVQAGVYRFAQNRVAIESASFGNSQSAVGAASLVFGEFMNNPLEVLDQLLI